MTERTCSMGGSSAALGRGRTDRSAWGSDVSVPRRSSVVRGPVTRRRLPVAPFEAEVGRQARMSTDAAELSSIQGTLEELSQRVARSEEHTSELQSLMRISYAVFCLKTKIEHNNGNHRSVQLRS